MANVAHSRESLNEEPLKSLKSYQLGFDDTGVPVNEFKYLEGHPRQYRFDAKDGSFNINGDVRTTVKKLVFQPFAWRIFTDNILNMGVKNWAEMFFIDDKNCVAAVLFHGFSVDNIFRLVAPLFYDELTLADVIITATPEKKENNKIQPKGVYYIAEFTYDLAPVERSKKLQDFANDVLIFRQETLTDIANYKLAMNFFNPYTKTRLNGELSTYQLSGEAPAPTDLFLDEGAETK